MATLMPIVDGTTATAAAMNTSLNALNADLGLPLALTGATAATRYVGGTTSGAPVAGTFAVGDFVIDQTGKVWVCTTLGTPGTWTQAGTTPTLASLGIARGTYTLSGGTATVAHGLSGTPTSVVVTPIQTNGNINNVPQVDSKDATNFHITSFGSSGNTGYWVAIL